MWPGGPLGFTSLKLSFAPESNMKTLLFLLWGMWHLVCVSGAWEALPLLCSPSQASCGHMWAHHVLCVQGRGGGGGGLPLCGWSGEEGMEGPVCRGSVGPCQVDGRTCQADAQTHLRHTGSSLHLEVHVEALQGRVAGVQPPSSHSLPEACSLLSGASVAVALA